MSHPHRNVLAPWKRLVVYFVLSTSGILVAGANKVLIFGLDAVRPDALVAANTPHLDSLMAQGLYGLDTLTVPPTLSSPGWSTVLTGVWNTKHDVKDNAFADRRFDGRTVGIRPASGILADTLKADTTLTAALNPWRITRDLVVSKNVTLTVEAGATLHFSPNAGIKVGPDGRLDAEGSEDNRIVMTLAPGSASPWDGIEFDHTLKDNVLSRVDMSYGDRRDNVVLVQYSKALIDNLKWDHVSKTIIEVLHPSLLVRNSVFPDVAERELIHGETLRDDEYLVLDGNTFGRPTGYNDVIDFSECRRPGPVFEVYNNVFFGGGDDALDLDGCDSHIEGNLFMNFHKANGSSSTSNALATGGYNGYSPTIVAARNVFVNNDHAVLLKENSTMVAENNVFVNCTYGAIDYGEWPDRTVDPGRGAYLDGNIFWNNGSGFQNQFAQPGKKNPEIVVNRCILPKEYHSLGTGNLDTDPRFVDPESDFHLLPDSPARGAGPNGLDMGRWVPAGASLSGEPDSVTQETAATLTVGGPGVTHYEYSVNDTAGPWSAELSVAEKPRIDLTGLIEGGTYTVYVKGKNSANRWQTDPEYAVSKTWRVSASNGLAQEGPAAGPASFVLRQNTPNPFNPLTVIEFELPRSCRVSLKIYDARGRQAAELVSGDRPAGKYKSVWDAGGFPSGVYTCRLRAGGFTQTRKMTLAR
jgi:hypothetical protein